MAEHGGQLIGRRLAAHGVSHLFTLCGGHISPILVGAKASGIRVIDVRDEASAVFAADAVSRMTGVPGVAAVTAGPGVTNAITAVKNAQMAQTPLLLLGGATPTVLAGRGALQDIDQLSLMNSITKSARTIKTVAAIGPAIDGAMEEARAGVPGPVFLEIPVDLLYPEALVREWYLEESGVNRASGIGAKALGLFLKGHLLRQFHAPRISVPKPSVSLPTRGDTDAAVAATVEALQESKKPALVIGSQALVNTPDPRSLATAVESMGVPVWLGGMARGLLGAHSTIQFRHHRTKALKEADLVIVAGFPFDFRLNYGRSISSRAKLITANLSSRDLRKNRRPDVAALAHPGSFIESVASQLGMPVERPEWMAALRDREEGRDAEIAAQAAVPGTLVNPLDFFRRLDGHLADDSVLVVDGGDFVATAAYILRPRRPLSWLDPGVFGTLGVGGGFAVGAAAIRPGAQVWLIYGDGSSAYSLAEFDTFVRHGLAPIAIVGTDGAWAQIARDQATILGDDVGTVLRRTDYHSVAEGYGGAGLLLTDPGAIDATLDKAREIASAGTPVCINVHIDQSDFRKGSISM